MKDFNHYFRFQFVHSMPELQQLQPCWNQLLDSIPNYLPSMTCEWHLAWLTANPHLANQLHYIFAFNPHQKIVGVIPLIKTTGKILNVPVNMLTLTGHRDHMKTLLISHPEHQLPLWDALLHYLTHEYTQWDLVTFRRLGTYRADDIFLERLAQYYHLTYTTESEIEIPYIPLEANWDTYWKSRSKHFRHEYRRKLKQLSRLGEISLKIHQAPLSATTLNAFVTLENKGWKGQNRSSLQYRPRLKKLYEAAARYRSSYFQLLQFELYLNEQLISASLCPRTKTGLFVYKIAYDETMGRYSPGVLLRVAEIQYAFEEKLQWYSFSGKAQPWMKSFTRRKHLVKDFVFYQHSFAAFLRHLGYDLARQYSKRFPRLHTWLRQLTQE